VIFSYSEYFTEEDFFEIEGAEEEEESDDEAVERLLNEAAGNATFYEEYTKQFLNDWEKYWTENGEQIVWSSWLEKYKDYINPDFDLVDRVKNMSLCNNDSDSNSSPRYVGSGGSSSSEDMPAKPSDSKVEEVDVSEEAEEKDEVASGEGNKSVSVKRKISESREAGNSAAGHSDTFSDSSDETTPKKKDETSNQALWDLAFKQHGEEEYISEYDKFYRKKNKLRKLNDGSSKVTTMSPQTRKYFAQRYQLFSLYDKGILLDDGKVYFFYRSICLIMLCC
jgi:hypothetical protein